MGLSKLMHKRLIEQAQREWEAEFYYLSMMAWCLNNDYDGFGAWFMNHGDEERNHGRRILNYLHEVNAALSIPSVQVTRTRFKSVRHCFELALSHEAKVSVMIHKLVAQSIREKDYRTQTFLQWYVEEQIEEESVVRAALSKIKRAEGSAGALLMVENQLAGDLKVSLSDKDK